MRLRTRLAAIALAVASVAALAQPARAQGNMLSFSALGADGWGAGFDYDRWLTSYAGLRFGAGYLFGVDHTEPRFGAGADSGFTVHAALEFETAPRKPLALVFAAGAAVQFTSTTLARPYFDAGFLLRSRSGVFFRPTLTLFFDDDGAHPWLGGSLGFSF